MQDYERNVKAITENAAQAHDSIRTMLRAMNKIGLTDEENEKNGKKFQPYKHSERS